MKFTLAPTSSCIGKCTSVHADMHLHTHTTHMYTHTLHTLHTHTHTQLQVNTQVRKGIPYSVLQWASDARQMESQVQLSPDCLRAKLRQVLSRCQFGCLGLQPGLLQWSRHPSSSSNSPSSSHAFNSPDFTSQAFAVPFSANPPSLGKSYQVVNINNRICMEHSI